MPAATLLPVLPALFPESLDNAPAERRIAPEVDISSQIGQKRPVAASYGAVTFENLAVRTAM
jgi:hypothetical protein